MKLQQTVSVPAPHAQVWAFIMDVPQVAACVPGVESVEPLDDSRYRGVMKVRVGPIALALAGDIAILSRDEAGGRATMRADAADKRIGGAVKATMELWVEAAGSDTTNLHITTDAQILGKIGEFGQPVIRKKADQIMQEFGANLSRAVGERSQHEVP